MSSTSGIVTSVEGRREVRKRVGGREGGDE